MRFIKLVLGCVLLLVIGYVGLSVATNRGLVNANYLSLLNEQVRHLELPSNILGATDSVEQLQSVISSQAVSEAIKVEPSKPPITQQAFEYVRYNYCQAVVKDYETRFPSE